MRRLHNPDMDDLVHDLNQLLDVDRDGPQDAALDPSVSPAGRAVSVSRASAVGLDPPGLERVADHEPLASVLVTMVERGASDLLLVPGAPPVLRVGGRLEAVPSEPVDASEVRRMFAPHLGVRAEQSLEINGAADLSLRLDTGVRGTVGRLRLRVNLQRQRGELAAAIRVLPSSVPRLEDLGLPPELARLVTVPRGLVLVCGPTGAGKSTTLAALVGVVNRTAFRHVITIEDPIEFEHANRQAVIEQVEVGRDTPDFATALRAALRRDPDVLLVGEMRDLETMATAVTAAETGHLILSTLHTADVAQAVHRIVDAFPAAQQPQVRHQLALSLHAIVCQQLVPRLDGRGMVPALEILIATHAVRNHIRRGANERLYNELLSGRALGMRSMEDSLAELVAGSVIDPDEARARTVRSAELERLLGARG